MTQHHSPGGIQRRSLALLLHVEGMALALADTLASIQVVATQDVIDLAQRAQGRHR